MIVPRGRKAAGVRWQTVVLLLSLMALLVVAAATALNRAGRPAPVKGPRQGAGWYGMSPAERLKTLGSGLRK